jgi:hypothetical protein
MSQLSTVMTWLCSIAVLFSAMPTRGYVWCESGDGTVTVEATDPEGRCLHPGETTLQAPTETLGPGASEASLSDGCVDVSLGDEALLARVTTFESPEPASLPLIDLFMAASLPAQAMTRWQRSRLTPVTSPVMSDALYSPKTVVLLV